MLAPTHLAVGPWAKAQLCAPTSSSVSGMMVGPAHGSLLGVSRFAKVLAQGLGGPRAAPGTGAWPCQCPGFGSEFVEEESGQPLPQWVL